MGQRASKRPQKADKTETRPTRTTSVHSYSINESCSYHINTPVSKTPSPYVSLHQKRENMLDKSMFKQQIRKTVNNGAGDKFVKTTDFESNIVGPTRKQQLGTIEPLVISTHSTGNRRSFNNFDTCIGEEIIEKESFKETNNFSKHSSSFKYSNHSNFSELSPTKELNKKPNKVCTQSVLDTCSTTYMETENSSGGSPIKAPNVSSCSTVPIKKICPEQMKSHLLQLKTDIPLVLSNDIRNIEPVLDKLKVEKGHLEESSDIQNDTISMRNKKENSKQSNKKVLPSNNPVSNIEGPLVPNLASSNKLHVFGNNTNSEHTSVDWEHPSKDVTKIRHPGNVLKICNIDSKYVCECKDSTAVRGGKRIGSMVSRENHKSNAKEYGLGIFHGGDSHFCGNKKPTQISLGLAQRSANEQVCAKLINQISEERDGYSVCEFKREDEDQLQTKGIESETNTLTAKYGMMNTKMENPEGNIGSQNKTDNSTEAVGESTLSWMHQRFRMPLIEEDTKFMNKFPDKTSKTIDNIDGPNDQNRHPNFETRRREKITINDSKEQMDTKRNRSSVPEMHECISSEMKTQLLSDKEQCFNTMDVVHEAVTEKQGKSCLGFPEDDLNNISEDVKIKLSQIRTNREFSCTNKCDLKREKTILPQGNGFVNFEIPDMVCEKVKTAKYTVLKKHTKDISIQIENSHDEDVKEMVKSRQEINHADKKTFKANNYAPKSSQIGNALSGSNTVSHSKAKPSFESKTTDVKNDGDYTANKSIQNQVVNVKSNVTELDKITKREMEVLDRMKSKLTKPAKETREQDNFIVKYEPTRNHEREKLKEKINLNRDSREFAEEKHNVPANCNSHKKEISKGNSKYISNATTKSALNPEYINYSITEDEKNICNGSKKKRNPKREKTESKSNEREGQVLSTKNKRDKKISSEKQTVKQPTEKMPQFKNVERHTEDRLNSLTYTMTVWPQLKEIDLLSHLVGIIVDIRFRIKSMESDSVGNAT